MLNNMSVRQDLTVFQQSGMLIGTVAEHWQVLQTSLAGIVSPLDLRYALIQQIIPGIIIMTKSNRQPSGENGPAIAAATPQ